MRMNRSVVALLAGGLLASAAVALAPESEASTRYDRPPTAVAVTGGKIHLVSTATGHTIEVLHVPHDQQGPQRGVVEDVVLSPDGQTAFFTEVGPDRRREVWRVATSGDERAVYVGPGRAPAVSPDGGMAMVVTGTVASDGLSHADGIVLFDDHGRSRHYPQPANQTFSDGDISKMSFSPDGSTLAYQQQRYSTSTRELSTRVFLLDLGAADLGEAVELADDLADPEWLDADTLAATVIADAMSFHGSGVVAVDPASGNRSVIVDDRNLPAAARPITGLASGSAGRHLLVTRLDGVVDMVDRKGGSTRLGAGFTAADW